VEYGKKMDDLRTELREFLWDGEFRHEVGATVSVDGKPHHPYAVFISRQTGKKAVVIANYDEQKTITAQVKLTGGGTNITLVIANNTVEMKQLGGDSLNRYRLVDDPAWKPTTDGILLPPCSAAVVVA
jgi:hypothetical protein